MTLNETNTNMQVLGSLMKNPLLLIENEIKVTDFDSNVAKIIFCSIHNLIVQGAELLTPLEIDQDIIRSEAISDVYKKNKGLEFLKDAYEYAQVENFTYYYNRLKKLALLRTLKNQKFDISFYYKDSFDTIQEEQECIERFDNAKIEDILNTVESKFNVIRHDFTEGTTASVNVVEGLEELVEEFKKSPEIGLNLEGLYFSSAVRGARLGKFYLRSATSGMGKTRLSVFDSCRIAFPERYSFKEKSFIIEKDANGNIRSPNKTLIITTEMTKDEIQTIILAYLSGVNEEHILVGTYQEGEEERILYALQILNKYSNCYFIEEINDPNLNNIQAVVKKHITLNEVQYVFYDYIFSSPSLLNQFSAARVREDVILMLLANQLKEIAKKYNVFIMSSTQLNADGMKAEGFKNEMCLRGAKSISDKADLGCIISKVSQKDLIALDQAISDAKEMNISLVSRRPTHILDIYKLRRGRYKNVRIWLYLDLGTGEREDLFMTFIDNTIITDIKLVDRVISIPNTEWEVEREAYKKPESVKLVAEIAVPSINFDEDLYKLPLEDKKRIRILED